MEAATILQIEYRDGCIIGFISLLNYRHNKMSLREKVFVKKQDSTLMVLTF